MRLNSQESLVPNSKRVDLALLQPSKGVLIPTDLLAIGLFPHHRSPFGTLLIRHDRMARFLLTSVVFPNTLSC